MNYKELLSKIDLRSGYHQIRMKDEDIAKLHFQLTWAIMNAPATFQSLMNFLLAPYLRKFVVVSFDDILIYSSSMAEHLKHLAAVFSILRSNKLFAKFIKCSFGQTQVAYPCHVVTAEGVSTDLLKFRLCRTGLLPLMSLS